MIPRRQIIGRLREAGYTFHKRAKRTEIHRKPGGGLYVLVPFRDFFTPQETQAILGQAKLTPAEIERFLATCDKDSPSN